MNTITDLTPHAPTALSANRSIGDILVATGRLKQDDAKRIIERAQKDNVQFGDAALSLKLLTHDDITYALSQQFNYSYLSDQDVSLSRTLVAAYKPFSRVGENLRAVRSQLMLRWFNTDPAHKVVAVVSAAQGDGRSFVAANLAIVFAQQGERTLLIDADMRAQPQANQHHLFKLGKSAGLSGVLAGRAGLETAFAINGLPDLVVLPSGALPPNPQELLGRPTFGSLLQLAAQQFDVIIVDTPSGSDFADAELIASRAGAAILVARKDKSLMPQASHLARRLQDDGVALLGSVLNDA